jgi:hypothetical protein
MNGFIEVIDKGGKGLVFGNSIYLPFRLDLLSLWVGKEMSLISSPEVIVDLCDGNGEVALREGDSWTNIVLRGYRDLAREFGNGKGHVTLYATEKGADLFEHSHRRYIRITFTTHEKELLLEIIDDPFQL